jgi:hypothetical protein
VVGVVAVAGVFVGLAEALGVVPAVAGLAGDEGTEVAVPVGDGVAEAVEGVSDPGPGSGLDRGAAGEGMAADEVG